MADCVPGGREQRQDRGRLWKYSPSTMATGDWLLRGQELGEPWVFLIASDGTVTRRWINGVAG